MQHRMMIWLLFLFGWLLPNAGVVHASTESAEGDGEGETPEADASEGGGDAVTLTVEELTAQLADVQKALKAANAESAERRHKLKAYEEAEQTRQREEMTEIERLTADLEAAQSSAGQLETLSAENETLKKAVAAQVKATTKRLNVPNHVRKLLAPMSEIEQLQYLTENADAFTVTATVPRLNGSGRGGSNQLETIAQKYGIRSG